MSERMTYTLGESVREITPDDIGLFLVLTDGGAQIVDLAGCFMPVTLRTEDNWTRLTSGDPFILVSFETWPKAGERFVIEILDPDTAEIARGESPPVTAIHRLRLERFEAAPIAPEALTTGRSWRGPTPVICVR